MSDWIALLEQMVLRGGGERGVRLVIGRNLSENYDIQKNERRFEDRQWKIGDETKSILQIAIFNPQLSGELLLHRLHHGFGAGVDVQFGINILQMKADGRNADEQLLRDGFIGQSFGECLQNLMFTLRKLGGPCGRVEWKENSDLLISQKGNGLANMKTRTERIGGSFQIDTADVGKTLAC